MSIWACHDCGTVFGPDQATGCPKCGCTKSFRVGDASVGRQQAAAVDDTDECESCQ